MKNQTRRPGLAGPNWKSPNPLIFISHTPQTAKTVIRPSHFKQFQAVTCHFQPCPAILVMSSHLYPFPAISSHFQIYPAISSHSIHFLPCPAISSNFQPVQPFQPFLAIFRNFSHFLQFPAMPAISSHFQPFPAIPAKFNHIWPSLAKLSQVQPKARIPKYRKPQGGRKDASKKPQQCPKDAPRTPQGAPMSNVICHPDMQKVLSKKAVGILLLFVYRIEYKIFNSILLMP